MLDTVQKYARKFGSCAIFVALCSGCAIGTPGRNDPFAKMSRQQLNEFSINCTIRNQQIIFLLSQLRTADDMLFSLNPDEGKQINWIIKSHLVYLRNYC